MAIRYFMLPLLSPSAVRSFHKFLQAANMICQTRSHCGVANEGLAPTLIHHVSLQADNMLAEPQAQFLRA
jgi:hypothetical protein